MVLGEVLPFPPIISQRSQPREQEKKNAKLTPPGTLGIPEMLEAFMRTKVVFCGNLCIKLDLSSSVSY